MDVDKQRGTKGNEVWIWSVVVELEDGTIKKFLFAGDRSLGTFLKYTGENTSSVCSRSILFISSTSLRASRILQL